MTQQLPQWLKDLVGKNKAALRTQTALNAQHALDTGSLHTVCVEAKCPNRGECFNCGDATFMILGDTCTRNCRFCAVHKGRPAAVDAGELRWQMWMHDFTIAAAAQGIGISERSMYNKLQGETEFTVSEAAKLARLLHLNKDKRDEIFFSDGKE